MFARILAILILITSIFTTPLVNTWACSTLWRWFVARDLGPGPSASAWYGIWVIVALILASAILHADLARRDKDKRDGWEAVTRQAALGVVVPATMALAVGVTWIIGNVVGWL